ncbi:hypothetical protein OsJ_25499 [Oryza sativa Japonica Group]|uniref:F-box domain-containing protein n=1 Tax=Oryza sativa subsp. japonica TaxID=39947 RepID=A3BN74_ORYSJ|nr:hypothetical protein OsJ_25499 [Oryza sativa Japonica Group]
MMKQRQTVSNLDIDGDLTYEILLRLPAKTVLRCGAVCKAWRRITTNPTFLSDHARHHPPEALLYNSFGKATSKINMELDALSVAAHHQAAEGLSVGADEPRRLDVEATEIELFSTTQYTRSMMTPAALHGHLHWLQHPEGRLTNHMAVFNMVDETFKQMTSPPVTSKFFADLLAIDKFLMASEFTYLGVDLWVMEGYGAMDERWELRHRVVLPWMRGMTLERPLLIEGGNDSDVIMGTAYGLGVYT